MDRRDFLKASAAAALGAMAGRFPLPEAGAAGLPSRSTVVCVKSAKVATESGFDADVVAKMVERGLLAFTNKTSIAAAWKEFVSPKDVIGLKINSKGRLIPTHRVFIEAVIKGLVAAGIDENNIIVWDQSWNPMQDAGYTPQVGPGVKYLASQHGAQPVGYDQNVLYEPSQSGKSCIAKILTQKTTALINLPVLKDHNWAGVTLALKNIAFGITSNCSQWHKNTNRGDPMIPEVCALPVVKEKLRLTILDALEACYDGGPDPRNARLLWKPGMIYVATDMVALDTIAAQVIDAKRKENNLFPATRFASYIATAAKMKLGTNSKAAIRVEKVTV